MSKEYDQVREKIRNFSTEASTSTKKEAKPLMADPSKPLDRPERVENEYIAAWKEKEEVYSG